jgi:hypothetical protein
MLSCTRIATPSVAWTTNPLEWLSMRLYTLRHRGHLEWHDLPPEVCENSLHGLNFIRGHTQMDILQTELWFHVPLSFIRNVGKKKGILYYTSFNQFNRISINLELSFMHVSAYVRVSQIVGRASAGERWTLCHICLFEFIRVDGVATLMKHCKEEKHDINVWSILSPC